MKKGKFIVIDGGDGCGKSTIIEHLKSIYTDLNKMVFTREPGGSPFAEKVRNLVLDPEAKKASGYVHFGLIWASRADHLEKLVMPFLDAGKNVITDRFDSSTYAYQIFAQKTQNLKELFNQVRQKYVVERCLPDLYIYLDVDPTEGIKRINGRNGGQKNHFDEGNLEYFSTVRDGYLEFIKQQKHIIVDANQDVETVKFEVEKIIRNLISN